jgi:RHS repeat-associated protein
MSGGVRGLLSQWRNGARYYYHFDGLGSVMQVTDGSQNVVARYKYDAWGNDLVDLQSPLPNPFKYVGGLGYYADRDSGLMLLGKRYYCAGVGRFWSLDPAKDGFNWYENALNQLVSLTDENGTRVFSYDANGNCVNDGKRLYEWDVQNRLIRVIVPNEGEVRFRYRADGMRVEKQVVGGLTTKYIYDGQTVIGEIRSDGTKRWYVVGAMGYVCRIDEGANGEILARDYFVYDGLGSCRALVSSNGVIVAKYDYDVYGSVRDQEGQRANSFKYVAQIGHPTDEETGLIYMRARYYDPEVGRFVSEDSIGDGDNWYVYTEVNPVNQVDRTGLASTQLEVEFSTVEALELAAKSGYGNSAAHAILGRAKELARLLQNRYNFLVEVLKYGFDKGGNLGIVYKDSLNGTQLFRFVYKDGKWIIKHTASKWNFNIPHNIPEKELQILYEILYSLYP